MINREMQSVDVLSYTSTLDEYGQSRMETPTSQTIKMMYKIYSQSNVSNPKYVDVDLIGITAYQNITTANEIKIGNDKYVVKYVIPSSRYYQVLMSKYV